MTSISLHPTPRWSDVAREQFHAVGIALRKEGVFFVALLSLFAALGISDAIRVANSPRPHGHMAYGPEAAIPMALAGMLIALGVWRDETPARRAYHWVMPVVRSSHALAKLLSGWIWLMLATAVYVLYIVGLSAVVNAIQGPSSFPTRLVPAWQWMVPFAATTVAYLLGSAAVVGSNHPIRWIGGLWAGYLIALGYFESLEGSVIRKALVSIGKGTYGLLVLVAADGARVERWQAATLLWGAIGAALLCIALYRRAEG